MVITTLDYSFPMKIAAMLASFILLHAGRLILYNACITISIW